MPAHRVLRDIDKAIALGNTSVNVPPSVDVVTRESAAAGAGLVPVSGGANKTIGAATPVDLSTVTVDTSDAPTDAAIVALFNALVAFGLASGTWTAAE